VRDRDYLLDRAGVVFKVIGDVHPPTHYLGYVKYYPDDKGDRQLFGRTYRQNTVVSKAFGILADRPECYLYSDTIGCVITGVPRHDVVRHYSCRHALAVLHQAPELLGDTAVARDLKAVIDRVVDLDATDLLGVTGSFLVGCFNARSDIDLVCYGPRGYEAARELFTDRTLIRPYEGDALTRLYLRRAKYMTGSSFDVLMRQETRKLQGLTAGADTHINCEPLREDGDTTFTDVTTKEVGAISVVATITDDVQGLATPALYGIGVDTVIHSTVDDPETFARRITHMRSYLGAYTGAFRTGDTVYLSGRLVHTTDGPRSGFGIELTPWTAAESYLATLAR
jgi:predicted nucleotidyltransferase